MAKTKQPVTWVEIMELSERLRNRPKGWRGEVHSLYQRVVDDRKHFPTDRMTDFEAAKFFESMGLKWRANKLYSSVRASLRPEDLVIDAIAKHYAGPAKGNSVITLGKEQPVAGYVFPGHNYQIGQRLSQLPPEVIPSEKFFFRRRA